MRVAFDEQIFLRQQFGGVSRYVCQLAAGLDALDDTSARIFAPVHVNHYLARLDPALGGKASIPAPGVLGRGPAVRMLRRLSAWSGRRAMRRYDPDVVHETYFSPAKRPLGRAARVLTVYDMIHEIHAAEFGGNDTTTAFKRASVERADRVICISDSTRNDLIELFGVPAAKAIAVHLGFDPLPAPAAAPAACSGGAPYLLYVGQRGGYKNFAGLLRAYAASPALREGYRLVCFGGGGLSPAEQSLIGELDLPAAAVSQCGGDDAQLAACYRDAAAFVYPSRYEGFGIPPLEAMSLGCPVICSGASSIPEVVGDAAVQFDPGDIDALRSALESTLASADTCASLVARGRERVAAFSWAECARRTRAVYGEVT